MGNGFYLSSHDYVSSPEPRKCLPIGDIELRWLAGKRCFTLASVEPVLPGRLVDANEDIGLVLLSPCTSEMSVSDVGSKVVMVDIYATSRAPSEDISVQDLCRIGVGTLHATQEEARQFAPVD